MKSALAVIVVLLSFAAIASADIYMYTNEEGVVCYTNTSFDKKEHKPVRIMRDSSGNSAPDIGFGFSGSYGVYVDRAAAKYALEPSLIHAVIKTESNGNHRAVSRKGAMGLMQLMPSTANDMNGANPFSPEQNIEGGSRYLRYLLERFNGNVTLALAAYNSGPKTVEKYGNVPPIVETRDYVKKVYTHYRGKKSYSSAPVAAPQEAKAEPAPKPTPVYKIVLEDGTVLFTNASLTDTGKKIRF